MSKINEWQYLIDDGDIRIDYKIGKEGLVEIKYTQHFFGSEDKVKTFEIFIDELGMLYKSASNILINSNKADN